MSRIDHYKGKLYKLERFENETLEDHCKRLLNGRELEEYYEDYREMLLDEYSREVVECKGCLYRVEKKELDEGEGVFNASKNEDGTINFEVRYYNGGCCFDEAIGQALNKNNIL